MKKIILATIALSLLSVQAAFAENLGALNSDTKPQRLLPASEFTKFLAAKHDEPRETVNADSNRLNGNHRSDFWGGYYGGYGGYGGYYGGYYPYSYYGSYYPYYGYGYGYSYPYYSYWLDGGSDSSNNHMLTNKHESVDSKHMTAAEEAARAPVVCFASGSNGNWFAQADAASNVERSQNLANHECTEAGGNCLQNLGCALAVDPQQ